MKVTLEGAAGAVVARSTLLGNRGEMWLQSIEGWLGTSQANEEAEPVPGADGAIMPRRLTFSARTVSVSMAGEFRSSVECAEVRDRLLALCSGEMEIEVEDAAGPRRSRCFASDAVEPEMFADERGFSAEVVLTCPDPVKYGPPARFPASGGVVRAFNEGNAPVWPRFEVSGSESVELSLGGHLVTWSGEPPAEIDFRDMSCTSGEIGSQDAFQIPPGASAVEVSADAGAEVAAVVEPGWR